MRNYRPRTLEEAAAAAITAAPASALRAPEPLLERVELRAQLPGQLRAELVVELADRRDLRQPLVRVDLQQLVHVRLADREPVGVESARRRHAPDRRVGRLDRVVAAPEHPLQHARVLAEPRPQPVAVARVLAEPVD